MQSGMATDCFAGYWWERWARKCVELIIKSYDLVGPTSKTHGGGKKHFLAFTSLTTYSRKLDVEKCHALNFCLRSSSQSEPL